MTNGIYIGRTSSQLLINTNTLTNEYNLNYCTGEHHSTPSAVTHPRNAATAQGDVSSQPDSTQ